MHIVLTDILTCPRCGPDYGLILRADGVHDRHVRSGVLGCPNCREQYRVRDGVVDFGVEPTSERAAVAAEVDERLAALLGVAQGPAFVLLAGDARAQAAALAAHIDELEVVTVGPDEVAEQPGVNPVLIGGARLPIANAKVSGVALTGTAADSLLEEGARVVSVLGRLVLDPAPRDAAARLQALGLRVAAQQDGTLVAVRG